MLLSRLKAQYVFNFPRTLVPTEINNRYTKVLRNLGNYLIREPIDYINIGIQGFTFPAFSLEIIEQVLRRGDRKIFHSNLRDRAIFGNSSSEITLRMKLFDGSINYFLLLEILHHYFEDKTNPGSIPQGTNIEMLMTDNTPVFKMTLYNVKLKSVSSIDFDYSENTVQDIFFDLVIDYDYMSVEPIQPQLTF